MKVYRGYNKDYPNWGMREGQNHIWTTDDLDYAIMYANIFDNGGLVEFEIDDNMMNVADEYDYENILNDDFGGDPIDADNTTCQIIKNEGYNVIHFESGDNDIFLILDKSLIKSAKEIALNNDIDNQINEVLKLSGVTFKHDNTKFVNKLNKFGMNIKDVDSNIQYKDGKGVVYNALDEELVNENDMIYNIFYKDLPLLESEFLMMKDDDTRFGGVYDVNSGEVYYFPKNIVHNEDEIRKSLKDGIVKFSYYKINEKIVGGILAYDKTNAMKTIKYLDKQQKSFEPEYYMLELDNGKGYKYINVTANGKEVYENISRDYIGSRENIRKMVIESSHRLNDDNHNMTWEEFVEKVGRINEFDGSVLISKYNTSIIIKQSGRILVRIGKNPYRKAYSKLKTFDEIYNMLVEKGFIEEQILTEAVNQHSLYHGCDLAYAVSMMIDNAMRGETIANINGKKYQGNSLTRSLQFAKDWQEERWDGQADELNQFWVVLELNKERLKTKYKVLPYNYWEDYFGQDYEHTIDRNGYGDQYEEFVVGRINNLMNYMDDVYLSDECFHVEYAEIFAIVKRELELRGENYTDSQIVKALQTLGIDKPTPNNFDGEKLDENYDGMPMVYPNPTYSEFHDIMQRFTTTGTLSAIIDGDDIYCWDSYYIHHGTMIRYIEDKMDIKISDNAIWVRFKEPNKVCVSGAYFDDYDDDELEELETQDFEEELKYNPVIRKYFPKGVKVVRYDRLDEEIVYAQSNEDSLTDIILKNPSLKELQEQKIELYKVIIDEDENFYFGDAYNLTHLDMRNIIGGKFDETPIVYNTKTNTFITRDEWEDDYDYQYLKNEFCGYLMAYPYIIKTFGKINCVIQDVYSENTIW